MRLLPAIALAFALIATPAGATTPLVPVEAHFQDESVLEGLDSPVTARFAPLPDGRIFVASKSGLVGAYDGPDDATPTVVVDLTDQVQDFWDRGLLGMALDPAFAVNGRLYLLFTRDKPVGSGAAPFWGDTCPSAGGACAVSGALVRVTVDALGVGHDLTWLLDEQW